MLRALIFFIEMAKNGCKSNMTETRMFLFRALKLLDAVRHTGIDANGREVVVVEVRLVTRVFSHEQLRWLDADNVEMGIAIVNDLAQLVRAAHHDVDALRSGTFTEETKVTFDERYFYIANEREALKKNLRWLTEITGGDISWYGSDDFPTAQLIDAVIPNIVGTMLTLLQAMRAKTACMILQKELDASEPKEKGKDKFVAVAADGDSPEKPEVRWKRRRTRLNPK